MKELEKKWIVAQCLRSVITFGNSSNPTFERIEIYDMGKTIPQINIVINDFPKMFRIYYCYSFKHRI